MGPLTEAVLALLCADTKALAVKWLVGSLEFGTLQRK